MVLKIRDSAIDTDFWMNPVRAEQWRNTWRFVYCLRFNSALFFLVSWDGNVTIPVSYHLKSLSSGGGVHAYERGILFDVFWPHDHGLGWPPNSSLFISGKLERPYCYINCRRQLLRTMCHPAVVHVLFSGCLFLIALRSSMWGQLQWFCLCG